MLLHVCLLNFILSIVLVLYNLRTNKNILFLGAMLLIVTSYILAYHMLITGESRFWLAVLWGNPAPLWYLGGPCLYLYVRGTLNDRFDVRKSDWIHAIPFLVSLAGILPYLFSSFDHKLEVADAIIRDLTVARTLDTNWILSVNANLLLRPSLMIGYALVSIVMIYRFDARLSYSGSIPHQQWKTIRNWMYVMSGTVLAANLLALSISSFYSGDPNVDRDQVNRHFVRLVSGYVLALMPVSLLLFPQILYGMPRYRKPGGLRKSFEDEQTDDVFESITDDETIHSLSPNYAQGQRPMEDPFKELGERLIKLMDEEKPYTNPDFSLDSLAELLEVPKTHLYYCFRNVLNTKFTRLRTDYRIEHAKKLLTEVDLEVITLDAVGKDSGFPSKSGFYNTFKAEVGCSPGEYAEQHQKLSGQPGKEKMDSTHESGQEAIKL